MMKRTEKQFAADRKRSETLKARNLVNHMNSQPVNESASTAPQTPSPEEVTIKVESLPDGQIVNYGPGEPIEFTESRRPKKAERSAIATRPGFWVSPINGQAYTNIIVSTVFESEDMRNAGQSIVRALTGEGWIKPEDPNLLCATPDGNTFNMVRRYDEVIAERRENDARAKSFEGFGKRLPFVEKMEIEETRRPLKGMKDEVQRWEAVQKKAAIQDNG